MSLARSRPKKPASTPGRLSRGAALALAAHEEPASPAEEAEEEERRLQPAVKQPLVSAIPVKEDQHEQLSRGQLRTIGANAMRGLFLLAQVGAYGVPPGQLEAYNHISASAAQRHHHHHQQVAAAPSTDLAAQCAGGCGTSAHVNVVSYMHNAEACNSAVCDVGCGRTIAHKACLDAILDKSPLPIVSISCTKCAKTIQRRRLPIASARGIREICRSAIVWVWSNLFFWPFLCFFFGLFTLWCGALIEHYDEPKRVPHPGTLFLNSFEYHPKDMDVHFESFNWFHRWMLGIASYLVFIFCALSISAFWCMVQLTKYLWSKVADARPSFRLYRSV